MSTSISNVNLRFYMYEHMNEFLINVCTVFAQWLLVYNPFRLTINKQYGDHLLWCSRITIRLLYLGQIISQKMKVKCLEITVYSKLTWRDYIGKDKYAIKAGRRLAGNPADAQEYEHRDCQTKSNLSGNHLVIQNKSTAQI